MKNEKHCSHIHKEKTDPQQSIFILFNTYIFITVYQFINYSLKVY